MGAHQASVYILWLYVSMGLWSMGTSGSLILVLSLGLFSFCFFFLVQLGCARFVFIIPYFICVILLLSASRRVHF